MSAVFPFHFSFDRRGKILQYGIHLPRLCPALTRGADIGELFRILTPTGLLMTLDAISGQLFSVFFIECLETRHVIKGQMIVLDHAQSDSMMFLCSPLVRDVSSVRNLGLSFNDFALHDATVDFLFLLQTKVTTIDDVRLLAERLKQEVQVRREAEQALQSMNDVLEQRVKERTADLAIARDKADAANKTKSAFLSNMSHELRTPLNAILGYAQILQRDANLTARQIASLQTMNDSGDHLLMLITDLLDLAKIEAGKSTLHLSAIYLRHFLQGVMAMLRVRAEQKGLVLLCDMAPELPNLVLMDEKRVRQIVLNLLNNAVKFTDRGHVTLRVTRLPPSVLQRADQACVRFEIEDSGIGIPAEQLAIIFEPFEQVGDQQKHVHGTGLGLPISQQLTELMESTIELRSTPDHGSVFWFDLMLGVPESESESESRVAHAIQRTRTDLADAGEKARGSALAPGADKNEDENKNEDESEDEDEDEDEAAATLIPPAQEIDKLYQFALAGNMRKITQHATQLLAMDYRYHRFVDQLNTLARDYQTKAILALIEVHLSAKRAP